MHIDKSKHEKSDNDNKLINKYPSLSISHPIISLENSYTIKIDLNDTNESNFTIIDNSYKFNDTDAITISNNTANNNRNNIQFQRPILNNDHDNIIKCPSIPPNLIGPIVVDTNYEKLDTIELRLCDKLIPGGWYKPIKCKSKNRVAIIIPYRDREIHLSIFLKNIHPFLMKQQIEYGIFVIEQIIDGPFNRAALINIGFIEALKLHNWDCFIFHDIDLLPMDDRNLYTCPDQPRHMSVAVDTLGFK